MPNPKLRYHDQGPVIFVYIFFYYPVIISYIVTMKENKLL